MNKSGRPSDSNMTIENAQPQAKGMDKARPPSDDLTVESKYKTVIHKSDTKSHLEKPANNQKH
jgi:hypothetical protein